MKQTDELVLEFCVVVFLLALATLGVFWTNFVWSLIRQ